MPSSASVAAPDRAPTPLERQSVMRTLRTPRWLRTEVLAGLVVLLFLVGATRDREIVLQPIVRSPLTLSSSGVSEQYLEMVTRDTALMTLNHSPENLEYWMDSILAIAVVALAAFVLVVALHREQREQAEDRLAEVLDGSTSTVMLRSIWQITSLAVRISPG